jgi:hypothetical protein
MFESLDSGDLTSGGSPKAGTWASMNAIQKTGMVGSAPFVFLSWVFHGKAAEYLGMIGWTSILLGYVAGNFWRYRHAMHFWWSTSAAVVIHASLLPTYAKLTRLSQFDNGHSGKAYFQLTFLLMIVETLTLQVLLKRVAIFIHRRTHPFWNDRPQIGAR